MLIPVICIALLIANFTSIRLSIKGYHKEDKKVVLKLEKDDIKDILDYDQIIDISKWDKVKNDSHYLLYDEYYRASKKSVKKVVYYIDSYYERMEDLNYLGYTKDVLFKDTFNKLGYKTKINTHTTSCINLFLDIYLYSEYRLIYC